ncbi:hypothetical protein [Pedobacter panaciterrae]
MHTYTLSLEDVVTYNQYNLSIKKKNVFQKLRIVASVYFVLLGVLFIYITNYIIGGIFILFGLLYPLLGAKYVKWAYTKTFRKVILTDCSGLINAPNTFSVADNKIVIQDQGEYFTITYLLLNP